MQTGFFNQEMTTLQYVKKKGRTPPNYISPILHYFFSRT